MPQPQPFWDGRTQTLTSAVPAFSATGGLGLALRATIQPSDTPTSH